MYAIEGVLRYRQEPEFFETVQYLYDNKHVNNDGYFVDENGNAIGGEDVPHVDKDILCISLPYHIYKGETIEPLIKKTTTGIIIAISTGDDFLAYVYEDGNHSEVDLFEWAKENVPEPQPDVNSEEYQVWRENVEEFFRDTI